MMDSPQPQEAELSDEALHGSAGLNMATDGISGQFDDDMEKHKEMPDDDKRLGTENITIDNANTAEDSEDEFDDFNAAARTEADSDEGSDFGSFDNVSVERLDYSTTDTTNVLSGGPLDNNTDASNEFLKSSELFMEKISKILDEQFTATTENSSEDSRVDFHHLLDKGGQSIEEFSRIPKLSPHNWVKSNIRRNLFIQLGIPINLDEFKHETAQTAIHPSTRRPSSKEEDIEWSGFEIPELEKLEITGDERNELESQTAEMLSSVEKDNLEHSSEQFLKTADINILQERLEQFRHNHELLIKLSSVWRHKLMNLKEDYETFESVVQNITGYSQKLKREEILNSLKKMKSKDRKRHFEMSNRSK
ncbi:Piso0_000372 [Millerozyma farinosa CBS 7064]|uniref:Piso0_000372 protein n=1 Tax=Pichia sorbitophila (strain ATCC MYA-4447 / BCRC 22081 / CBS 7064 / NBRC 10061 / NRRL Y-12695) TaxID=559304 RepID=G8YV95_PICSO|nr:Piso0_000372 [Millerozyma farinosa CBS 7064]CCE73339.1 Piso0_000372 [Millerozyma farinosa CBS 7064]